MFAILDDMKKPFFSIYLILSLIPVKLFSYQPQWSYEYDDKKNLIREKQEDGNWEEVRYVFDAMKYLNKMYEYDDQGRLIYERWPYESWYDAKGNLIHRKLYYEEFWHEYDDQGRLIHEKWSNGAKYLSEYDTKGDTKYEYDDQGRLIHEKWLNEESDGIETWYEYDENGNLIHLKRPNGQEEWYDSKGRLIDIIFKDYEI